MPFIGIVGKVNDSNFIKNGLTKNSENTKFEIINIPKVQTKDMPEMIKLL